VRAAALGVRFLLEVGALAALAYGGAAVALVLAGNVVLGVALAVVAVVDRAVIAVLPE
jgi:hypothetical protein